MQFRKAKTTDLKNIARIFKEEYNKPPYNENWDDKNSLIKIKVYFENEEIFVVEDVKIVGFIIGYIKIFGDHTKGMIDEFVIEEKRQGNGIGSALIKFMEDEYLKRGVKYIELLSHKESKAFNFYKKRKYFENKLVMMEKLLK